MLFNEAQSYSTIKKKAQRMLCAFNRFCRKPPAVAV